MVETVSKKILVHITEQCLICCDVGVPCCARQACDDPSSLIFAFQVSIIQCASLLLLCSLYLSTAVKVSGSTNFFNTLYRKFIDARCQWGGSLTLLLRSSVLNIKVNIFILNSYLEGAQNSYSELIIVICLNNNLTV